MSAGNRYWFPSAQELRRLEKLIAGTSPRASEAEEYAALLKAPVDKMRTIVRDMRARVA